MSLEAARPLSQNSFLNALHSEMVAGSESLSAWIRQVQTHGAIDSLFGLETWLKGVRAFLNLDHLPLSEADKSTLPTRSFAPEIAVVRQALQRCEAYLCDVMDPAIIGKFEFEDFVESQMRRDRLLDYSISRLAEQLTPSDSIGQLSILLNDIRVMTDSMELRPGRDFQLFLTIARTFNREIKNCRYVDMLMSQRFRIQYDLVENQSLTSALRRIPEEVTRQSIALVFLYLFRFLRYLKLVRTDLSRDRFLKPYLVIFALIHEEMSNLSDLIKTRLLRNREVGNALQNAAELISYSMKTESLRVQTKELAAVTLEMDPGTVYGHFEDSHGILRNCCETCIVTLIQSVDKNFDAAALFPTSAGQRIAAEKLRQDLWDLRRWLMNMLANENALDSSSIIERISEFKEESLGSLMYRDWAEFEGFSDSLALSISSIEIRTQIRKFVSYIEKLVQEVSKRSVFREDQQQTL